MELADDKAWVASFPEDDGMVLVWAPTIDEAKTQSGLVFEEIRLATDSELDEWEDQLEQPLTLRELELLATMIDKRRRYLAQRRIRNRVSGRTSQVPLERDADRRSARALAILAGKLDAMARDREGG